MIVNQQEVITLFHLKKSGNKGWMLGHCSYCGKDDHMGVIFGKTISSFTCKKCGVHGTLWKLLQKVNRLDLLDKFKIVNRNNTLEKKKIIDEIELDLFLPRKTPPIGFKRIFSDEYLGGRGFTPEQFKLLPIGRTFIDSELKNYLIFLVEEDEECKGYIARHIFSKEKLDSINKIRKSKGLYKILRYRNSPDTDFGKMLYGYNEITEETLTVILVEGLTDKTNIDIKLDLYISDVMKCNACFGKTVSPHQIRKLQDKNIENIILLFDPDAINESKEYAIELYKYFNVEVGWLKGSKDPGDLNLDEILDVLENLENPVTFSKSKLQKKVLT